MTSKYSSWRDWANYVIKTLEENKDESADNRDNIHKLRTEIKIIQTKMTIRAGITGALAAMVPVTIALIIYLLTKGG